MALTARRGFVHYATFPGVATPAELDESLGIVLDAGFEIVEVSTKFGPALLERAAALLTRRGAAVYLSAGPEFVRTPRSLCDPVESAREAAVQRALELIDLASSLGARNLMLVSGADPGAERRDQARAALAGSLRRIAAYARERSGLRITLETFARDRAPAQLLGPSDETLALLDEIGARELGVTTDLAHLVQLGEDVRRSAATLARLSGHVHLSTCLLSSGHPLDGDQHPTFDEPGVALSIGAAARAVGGLPDGELVLSVEIQRHHGEDPRTHVAECLRYWTAATSCQAADGVTT